MKVRVAIVSVPVRADAFGLDATLKPTGPLPLPLAPFVTVIQLSLLAADQSQPAPEVTVVEPVPPAAATDKLFDEIANVHPAAACVTVNVWPATVSVPLRGDVLGLADALNATLPLPLPVAPPVTVNHPVSLLTPVQAHPVDAVTFVEPVAVPAAIDWLGGEMEYIHCAPACVTLNVWPPMVSVPVRALVSGLAAALNATVPLPVPLAPLVNVNHDVLLLTPVQGHPVGAATPVEPVPPVDAMDWLGGVNV